VDSTLSQLAELEWNGSRRVRSASGACQHVLGRSSEELQELPIREALGISEQRLEEMEQALPTNQTHVEFVHGLLAGKPRVFRLVMRRVQGGAVRACILDLEDALEHAPPVQISRLSSSLSHEIRNPLSSVKMAVQTLARNPGLSERDQRRLAIANREVRTMERMLWLLSEYGRDSFPALEPMPLRSVVQEAAALVAAELNERKILLHIDEPADAPRARVDVARFRPVLAQLLLNVATGHTEGATLVVTLRTTAAGGSQMHLEDPSATLPPEEKESVFEPFGSMLARGAGLSLAALYQVMKGHGGDVTADASNPGTRYTLVFPPA
jgi:two-component system, NtrC family, sensor histidine kinase HydH